MKTAYVTTFDSKNLDAFYNWAGLGYYIAESLKSQSINLDYFGPLNEKFILQAISKIKRHYHEISRQGKYFKNLDPLILENYSNQVLQKLKDTEVDLVFSATVTPIAYLDCPQPIVFWADATFQNLLSFYPQYEGICQESIQHGHQMENMALQHSKLAIYSSEWAAQTAIEFYNADPDKVKVVPFGSNIKSNNTIEEIKEIIKSRPRNKCKLLFIGIDWIRKGGDVAVEVAINLNRMGLDTELTMVGCQPIVEAPLPDFIKPLGFISKSSAEGKEKLYQLISESHFLILPSLADCTPIVFCEANSLGVPCFSRKVGGIPTIIKDDLNGKLFDVNADVEEYCQYIYNIFSNYLEYTNLAISCFIEYQTRLNWSVSGDRVRELLKSIL